MKNNKQDRIRRRIRRLTIAAIILGFLAVVTGYLGFFSVPVKEGPWRPLTQSEDLPPETAALPTEAAPPEQPQDVGPNQPENVPPGQLPAPGEEQPAENDQLPEIREPMDPDTEDPLLDEGAGELSAETVPENNQPPEIQEPMAPDTEDPLLDEGAGELSAETVPENNHPPEIQELMDPDTESPLFDQETGNSLAGTEPGNETEPPVQPRKVGGIQLALRIACCIFLTGELLVILLLVTLRRNIRQHEKRRSRSNAFPPTRVSPIPMTWRRGERPMYPIPSISLGKLHNVGRRDYQQDSFGHTPVLEDTGLLAVLADGMGGLSDGERVSQKIVMEALNYGAAMTSQDLSRALPDMVDTVNTAVNRMLGPQGLYTSGSTVVAALIAQGQLWWISVGDSRVYLYRGGQINQLSRDHDLLQEWMGQILVGERSMAEALGDPEGRKLTSFIGMGQLRYVDACHRPIPLLPGDRVVLMSDGIYGTVSDEELQTILAGSTNVQEAAAQVGQRIRAAAVPYQDNYTLVILGYDPAD